MVVVKTARELSKMKDACRISAEALRVAGEAVKPGVTTYEIDNIVRSYIEKQGAVPSFLGYGGFPASACISVNNVVNHGISLVSLSDFLLPVKKTGSPKAGADIFLSMLSSQSNFCLSMLQTR